MERNRGEGRRMAAANGLSRRRQRSSSLIDSPEEDGAVEMQETAARLRDRGNNKKDRDRDRLSSRSKRRRGGDRLIHGSSSNREEGEDSTEESVDDDEEYEDGEAGPGPGPGPGPVRMLPPNPASSSSISNHHHHHHNNRNKSFPPAANKMIRTAAPVLKAADEMIGVSVPRKARSASVKRSHEYWNPGGGGGGVGVEQSQSHRQASISPARPSIAAASSPAAPISPPSNASVKKKMKSLGSKQRPPKMSKPSSVQDDIEIEVAEVLYGLMRQSHCPSKPDYVAQKPDWKDANGSSGDVRSRISSPTSNSPSAAGTQSSILPQNSNSSTTPSTAVAPKRKRPRPVKVEEECRESIDVKNSSTSAPKIGSDQPGKVEASSPKSKNNTESVRDDGGVSSDIVSSQAAAISIAETESVKPESNIVMDSKVLTEELGGKDEVQAKEEVVLPKNESSSCKEDGSPEDAASAKSLEVEGDRNEKFKIDLMVPPPLKSSPDSDGLTDFASDPRPVVPDVETEKKMESVVKDEQKIEQRSKQDAEETAALVEKKTEVTGEDFDSQKKRLGDSRVRDLHLDLEQDLDRGSGNANETKTPQTENQLQSKAAKSEPKVDKSARFASLPLPITLAGWPGSLPPLGFTGQLPPLPGVLPLDGSSGSSNVIQQPHLLQSQRRPKCATHYYIARNIYYHQQFARMNPYWPTSAGSASVYGTKPYNLNIVPQTENTIMGNPLPGIFPVSNSLPEKNKVAATSLPSHNGKDKSSVTANFMDGAQTKQLMLQQAASQPATAANLLHGPAFIFPLSQQQPAAATQSVPGKSSSTAGNAASTTASNNPASGAQGKNSITAAATMSFSYPNLPNEPQYLAVLQNNGYPFPVPSHVGAPPPYRGGTHAQAMPFFNGSFYSSQVLHPSQLQQQPQPHHSQQHPVDQGHQNMSTASGSSASQKHQQNQQQRAHGGGSNGGAGSSHFPSKNRAPPQQHNQNVSVPHNARQLEAEMGREESPSTADRRVSHLHKNIYCQNFSLPLHPQNFALMSPAALAGSASGNSCEESQQSSQQQSLKGAMELIPSQAFAMSFAAFNGGPAAIAAPGLDFSSITQNHPIFQSLPEAARREYQIAAVSQAAAQQSKAHQISEEGKTVSDSTVADEEKKVKDAKGLTNVGQSLVFSRSNPTDHYPSSSAVLGNPIIDGSGRTLNLISPVNGGRASSSGISSVTSTAAVAVNSLPQQQQQQQLLMQLQKQQQHQQLQQPQLQQQLAAAASVPRTKQSATTNTNAYSTDRLPVASSSMSAKFPNAISVFPQALMHVNNPNPTQNPQWKQQSTRTMTSSTHSLAPATTASSQKNLSQQQGRTQQGLSQISFGVSPKSSAAQQHGQQLSTSNPAQSPPLAVGSPSASVSKGAVAGGSPRTTSSGSKVAPSPVLSSSSKNSPQSGPSRKSSPVGGRSMPSILGNAPVPTTSCSSTSKLQLQPQQQQQHHQKQQQQQLFFPNAYMQQQAQSFQSSATATASISAGYYNNQRRQPEQHQQQQQQIITSSGSFTGGLLCPPLALTSASTADPAKAISAAAAGNNMKGVLPIHTAQFAAAAAAAAAHSAGNSLPPLMSTAFTSMYSVPPVPVKPTEHKQPAGNDNLRASWQPEKS